MKYFIDTEFLEGVQERPLMLRNKLGHWMIGKPKPTIDLISIGIVAEDGREYYAISKDFNLKEAWDRCEEKVNMNYKPNFGGGSDGHYNPQFIKEYWIRENVLKPICKELAEKEEIFAYGENNYFIYKVCKKLIKKYGKTNKQIAEEIKEFVYIPYKIDWIKETGSEICGFNEFLKRKQSIEFYGYYADYDWVVFCWLFGKMVDLPTGFPMYCIDLKQELDRIEKIQKEKQIFFLPLKEYEKYPKQTNEHNALSDSRFVKDLYYFLKNL